MVGLSKASEKNNNDTEASTRPGKTRRQNVAKIKEALTRRMSEVSEEEEVRGAECPVFGFVIVEVTILSSTQEQRDAPRHIYISSAEIE